MQARNKIDTQEISKQTDINLQCQETSYENCEYCSQFKTTSKGNVHLSI